MVCGRHGWWPSLLNPHVLIIATVLVLIIRIMFRMFMVLTLWQSQVVQSISYRSIASTAGYLDIFDNLRNRQWGGSVYVLQMFFFCFFGFCFFFVRQKYETTVLGNGWTDFHETFTKRYWETWMEFETSCRRLAKVMPPPGEWRMLMICVIYALTLPQSPESATHGGCVYKCMSARMDLIQFCQLCRAEQ